MGYTKELKADRKVRLLRMQAIVGDGHRSLSAAERTEFDQLEFEIRTIDTKIARARDDTPQNNNGSSRRGRRPTADDERFTTYLRGKSSAPEYRASLDANGLSTAPNSGGLSPGATGYDAGYMIPQGFWAQLAIALKAYGGLSSSFRYVETPTGAPTPWPSTQWPCFKL